MHAEYLIYLICGFHFCTFGESLFFASADQQ